MTDEGTALVPVFVDTSGRRARLTRQLGLVIASVCALYLLLVGAALVASPGVLPLSVPGFGSLLPGPGAPPLSTTAGRPRSWLAPSASSPASPRGAVPGRSPLPRTSSARVLVVSLTPIPIPIPTMAPTTAVMPTAAPSAAPTATPSPSSRRTGKPTSPPGAKHPTGRR